MENENLTPEQSFELITNVIKEARNRFEENGFIYVFWGALVAIAAISQFLLLQNNFYKINWYPYLLMPLGAVFSGIYYSKKGKKSIKNQVSSIVSISWIAVTINILLLGFAFAIILRENLIPVILIFLAIGIFVSAAAIKSKLLYFSAFVVNISAFAGFYLDWKYQALLMGIIAITAILIPGIILMIQNKKRNV